MSSWSSYKCCLFYDIPCCRRWILKSCRLGNCCQRWNYPFNHCLWIVAIINIILSIIAIIVLAIIITSTGPSSILMTIAIVTRFWRAHPLQLFCCFTSALLLNMCISINIIGTIIIVVIVIIVFIIVINKHCCWICAFPSTSSSSQISLSIVIKVIIMPLGSIIINRTLTVCTKTHFVVDATLAMTSLLLSIWQQTPLFQPISTILSKPTSHRRAGSVFLHRAGLKCN